MKKILIINILTFLILGILSCSVNPKTKTSQSLENEETKVSPLNEILKKIRRNTGNKKRKNH